MIDSAAHNMGKAVDGWITRNIPAPKIALVAPTRIDALVADFYSRPFSGIPDKRKGIYVLGLEVAPDPRVDPGVIVFVDENFKFVGATVLP